MENNFIKHPFYKKLLKEFHPTKNDNLKLSDFSYGSHKKVWWKCDVADDHEWKTTINSRILGRGCPCCSNQKTVLSNCLATTHPEIAKQWHPTKNGKLTPFDVTYGSDKKAWWKCNTEDDHIFNSSIGIRVKYNGKGNSGCPCCAGQKAVPSNCLATTHPEIAKQWHQDKNGSLTPFDITYGSNKKVFWKCEAYEDHEWEALISSRASSYKSNCPCCDNKKAVLSNCLATTHPEIAKQWHRTKNKKLTPFDVTYGSNKKAFWSCIKNNEHCWESVVKHRKNNVNCPICNEYKGEKRIRNVLEKLSIKYETQKRFENCRYKNKLSFDFYLPNNNYLIEYDGKQHLEAINFFGGDKTFKEQQVKDAIKNRFAKNNNINLLRIIYVEFNNIENIIKKALL